MTEKLWNGFAFLGGFLLLDTLGVIGWLRMAFAVMNDG